MNFEEEKTENPTARKLKEAKKRGLSPRSLEFSKSLFLFLGVSLFSFLFSFLEERVEGLFRFSFVDWLDKEPAEALSAVLMPLLLPLFLFFILLFTLALMLPFIQGGWSWVWYKRKRKKEPLSLYRLTYLLIEILVITLIGYLIGISLMGEIKSSLLASSEIKLRLFFKVAFLFLFATSAALLLLSLFDLFYSRWRFNQSMKMSRQEIKEEMREEGKNPIKDERKR